MADNGAGVFERPVPSYTFDTVISETDMNTEMDGIATGLSNRICKDGQTTITANIPMASHKFTGLSNGAARTDSIAYGQVQDGNANWVDGGGTADAITATYSPAITTLVDGQECFVRATAANATTTPTFSPSGLTARTIVKEGGSALVAGDIKADGHNLHLRYDLANTRWELLNPAQASTSGLLTNVVEDTTPQLGGNLDLNGHGIVLPGATVTDVTGADTLLCSGTAGTSGNLASWNVDGDLVDSGVAAASPSAWLHSTSAATTSGTSAAFTSLPAGLTEIVLTFEGVQQNTANNVMSMQIGDSGGLEATGYGGALTTLQGASGAFAKAANSTTFQLTDNVGYDASESADGKIVLHHLGSNRWAISGNLSIDTSLFVFVHSGTKALSATLDRLTISITSGAFTAGTIYLNAR